jgi:hypothetical protein
MADGDSIADGDLLRAAIDQINTEAPVAPDTEQPD